MVNFREFKLFCELNQEQAKSRNINTNQQDTYTVCLKQGFYLRTLNQIIRGTVKQES